MSVPRRPMSALSTALVAELADALGNDAALAERLADALAPHLPDRSGGWLAAPDAATYLGLGSLDALDRAVVAGLPYAQPHGPGGRRYFKRAALDAWMEGAA
jgi:hypothetical protein